MQLMPTYVILSAKHFYYSRSYPKSWFNSTTHRKLKQVPKSSGFILKNEFSSLEKRIILVV